MLSERTETIPAFSVKNYTYFHETARKDNTVLEVTVDSGRADAYLRMWDSGERQPIVIPASGPRSEAFLPASTVTLNNSNTTGVNNVIWEHYASDQDNTHPTTTSTALLNSETLTEQTIFDKGALHMRSLHAITLQARTGYTRQPVFSLDDAATERGRTFDTTPDVNLSINGLAGGSVDLINTSPGPVTATVTSYDSTGSQIGNQTTTILRQSHTTLNVPNAARVMIDVAENNNPQNEYIPRVMAYATTTIDGQPVVKEGYKLTQTRKVTGEEYVASWLDGLQDEIAYLNNDESRCLINGGRGTKSYATDLAQALYPTSNYPGSVGEFEQFIRRLADGDLSNGELYRGRDPIKVSGQSISQYNNFHIEVNDNAVTVWMNSTNTPVVLTTYRDYLVKRVDANPQLYGGSAEVGADLGYDPTWHSRNPN